MALVDSLIVFVVSLLIGAFGIHVGGQVVAGVDDYTYAIITALVGAVIWVLAAVFVGWIPLLGPILALLAYIAVINARYPGDWGNAIAISLIAWVISLAVLYVLAILDVTAFDAFGVPGL